ncbi:MAG: hypothetical protein VB050_02090 [Geobacteraceae bacterium]|nr:hypothetical protein [Geobacteraceae bacterium]
MKKILFLAIALASGLFSPPSWALDSNIVREQVKAEARRGFEEILDLWSDESYEALYHRLIHLSRSDFSNFADQMNHSGRKPACCWERLQDISVTFISQSQVALSAKVGIEVEGMGTRFVTRTFKLVKEEGVWKIPEADVISIAEPNMQRIPKEIFYRAF